MIDVDEDILLDAILYDELTDLMTRRAYNANSKLPVQVAIDHVGLHDINEEYGRDIGDWILCRSAEIVMRHANDAYRIFSDKFAFQSTSYEAANRTIEKILLDLTSVHDTLKKKSGEKFKVTGISIYYGMAETMNDAFMKSSDKKKIIKAAEPKV